MFLTLELPIRSPQQSLQGNTTDENPLTTYERRFGALPYWLDELSLPRIRGLVDQALRQGTPLPPANLAY